MAAAIREGRFEIGDMVAALEGSAGSVEDAAERTLRFSDRLNMLKNRITGVLGPFGEIAGVAGGAAAALGPLLFGFVSDRFGYASGWWLGATLLAIAVLCAALGERRISVARLDGAQKIL
jgi:MFS family permease